MKQFSVFGQKVAAHDKECADCYRQDRRLGIIYPAFDAGAEGGIITWAAASVRYNFCVYCGAQRDGGNASLEARQ